MCRRVTAPIADLRKAQGGSRIAAVTVSCACILFALASTIRGQNAAIGQERGIRRHLTDGEEFELPVAKLIAAGEAIFSAKFTVQDGAGRPLAKGTANGSALSDPSKPLIFPRNFNRISGPDANSCAGCHNEPFEGGGGDRATEVFVLGNRFDFATFDHNDEIPTKGVLDERGEFATLQNIANERKTIGMNGSGYIEMLARQMTADLQSIRESIPVGFSRQLITKRVDFGTLVHRSDGSWDTSEVQGLTNMSTASADGNHPPSLVVLPFQQASSVVSLRQFSNNAFTQHFGMQSAERFPNGDEDGDGVSTELTRGDITAVVVYQATLPVPGQLVPHDAEIESAIRIGKAIFTEIGCATCHVPRLPLDKKGWIFSEPNPFNPSGNLQRGQVSELFVDLSSDDLPGHRLKSDSEGIVWVPAFTDLKIHDITSGRDDPNGEALDQNQTIGSNAFFSGNTRFITRKLWGVGNSGPYMHHGKFTTMREAILNHFGEALRTREAFQGLSPHDSGCLIEFLKSMQILPPEAKSAVIDGDGKPRDW